jgi:hypothetical protein
MMIAPPAYLEKLALCEISEIPSPAIQFKKNNIIVEEEEGAPQ